MLTSCGENPYIADKVKFRVIFSQRVAQVSFTLNSQYQLKTNKKIAYTDDVNKLGIIFLKFTETPIVTSEVGSLIFGEPENLKLPWPTTVMKKLPNGKKLPPSIHKGELNGWSELDGEITYSFLHQAKPDLITGGSIQGTEFNALPKKFLATQRFLSANKEVEATISATGPTNDSQGGIYFFGNFGINPFEIFKEQLPPKDGPPLQKWLALDANKDVVEWELIAEEPAIIAWPFFLANSSNDILDQMDLVREATDTLPIQRIFQ